MSEAKRIQLKVVGERTIHCDGCENTVEFTLSKLPGVQRVAADRHTQGIMIELGEEGPGLEQIKSELEWIGYEVQMG